MSSAMQVILLERVDNLGQMGEVVKVRNGYARNYLLPQKKALRATKDNLAYFETQRAVLEKANAEKRSDAEKLAKKFVGMKVVVVRHAAEGGQLFGSVTARDVAEAITEQGKQDVGRSQVVLNQGFKTIGLFPVTIALHPEVRVEITVNVARTAEEAKIQEKTGKAVILDHQGQAVKTAAKPEDDLKSALLEDSALAAEQEWDTAQAEKAAGKAEKSAKRKAKRGAKTTEEATDEAASEEE